MADTTYGYTPGSGGLAAIDRITGTDYPYYKIKWGLPGTVTDVSATNPLPVATELGQLLGTTPTGSQELVPALAVRQDTPSMPHADGTYTFLRTDSLGKLWANVSGTVGVTGISSTPADRGAGPATAQTLRTTIDTGQLGALVASGVPTISGGYDWIFVPASSTAGVTLPSTVTGSYLEHLMCVVTAATTSKVQIKDGSGTVRDILPDNVAGGVGTYVLPLGITSKLGAWQVFTPGAGVSVIATFHV